MLKYEQIIHFHICNQIYENLVKKLINTKIPKLPGQSLPNGTFKFILVVIGYMEFGEIEYFVNIKNIEI